MITKLSITQISKLYGCCATLLFLLVGLEKIIKFADDKNPISIALKNNIMQEVLSLDNMSVTDKLLFINEIWESLEKDNDTIPSPDWHKDILLIRHEKVKNGTAKFKPFELVKHKLKTKINS